MTGQGIELRAAIQAPGTEHGASEWSMIHSFSATALTGRGGSGRVIVSSMSQAHRSRYGYGYGYGLELCVCSYGSLMLSLA